MIPRAPEPYDGSIDAQEPLGSLGRYLRTSWRAFPRSKRGYLVADEAHASELRHNLTGDPRLVVGLSWISRSQDSGKLRSAKLSDFASLLRLRGCRFLDLQYGDTLAEREAVECDIGVRVERVSDVNNTNDIDTLAALMTACDVVVTVDNTTAHLAGALGRPTWVLVPPGSPRIWYWFKGRHDSPWYPHVRVRNQMPGQPWSDLVFSVTKEVSGFIESRGLETP